MRESIETDNQKLWDKLLVEGWRRDDQYLWLLNRFFEGIGHAEYVEFNDIPEYMTQLGMKRWRTDSRPSPAYKIPIRVFVANCSPHLSACLFENEGPGNSDEEILFTIDHFEWGVPKKKSRSRPSTPDGMRHKIRFRDRDKRTDWNTVK